MREHLHRRHRVGIRHFLHVVHERADEARLHARAADALDPRARRRERPVARAPVRAEHRAGRIGHADLGGVLLVADVAADGGARAPRAGTDHDPARHGVAFALHLHEHALGDVVVAAPVRGPFGIGELVHVVPAGVGSDRARRVVHLGRVVHEVAAAAVELDLRHLFHRGAARHHRHEGQAQQPCEIRLAHCRGAARGLDDGRAFVHPAVAQRVQEQRTREPVLQAARGMGGLVLQVEVDAVGRVGRQVERDEVRVGAAVVVGLDAGNGLVQPAAGRGAGGGKCGHAGSIAGARAAAARAPHPALQPEEGAVGLDARGLGRREAPLVQQLLQRLAALLEGLHVERAHGEFVERAPCIDAGIHEQDVRGLRHARRLLRVEMGQRELRPQPVVAGQFAQGFRPRGPLRIGREVGVAHLVRRGLQTFGEHGDLEDREPAFLVPAAHRRAPAVGFAGLLQAACVPQALGQVERIARVAGLVPQCLFEHGDVAQVGLRIAGTGTVVRHIDQRAGQRLPGRMRGCGQELVQHALPAPGHARGDHGIAQVFAVAHAAGEHVPVRGQRGPGEALGHAQLLVRIDEEHVVRLRPGKLQRLVAVVREMLPGALVQAAGHALQEFAHDVLRAVGGTRVHDHPVVDEGPHGSEAPGDHRCLVLHDHVEADAGAVHDIRRRLGCCPRALQQRAISRHWRIIGSTLPP